MADRTGKCINFGLCSKADSRELIPVAGGEFSCPECGKPLTEASGGSGGGGGKQSSAKKAIAIGAVGMALIAGTAYKFLADGDKPADKTNNSQNIGVLNPGQNPQDPNAPTLPPGQPPVSQDPNAPQLPPQQPGMPPNRVPPPVVTQRTPPAQRPPATQPDVAPPAPASAGTMQARLLSPISTRNSHEGDQFQAKVENGPYRGGILTGTIKKLSKSKKNAELELDFTALNGKAIPMRLDLTDISNSQGVKGVDDENNRIVGQSSKKKMAAVTAIGAGVGAGLGRLMGHSTKSTLIGAGAGAGAGYLLSVKVISHAKDIELNAGSQLTLRESER